MQLVSVIIPCYNDGLYLAQSVGSILAQTYSNTEILIVNDGSTDAITLQLLSAFNHPKVTVLHKPNGHLASARNYGIAHAKGAIIATLDADDWYGKTFIAKALQMLNTNEKIGVVTCYLKSFGTRKYKWKPLGGNINSFLYRLECCASALFKKECWTTVGGYDEQMKLGYEDWEYWLRITAAGWQVAVVKEYLLNYRTSNSSMSVSQSEPNRAKIIKYIMDKHKDLYWQAMQAAIINHNIIDLTYTPNNKITLLKNLYWQYKK